MSCVAKREIPQCQYCKIVKTNNVFRSGDKQDLRTQPVPQGGGGGDSFVQKQPSSYSTGALPPPKNLRGSALGYLIDRILHFGLTFFIPFLYECSCCSRLFCADCAVEFVGDLRFCPWCVGTSNAVSAILGYKDSQQDPMVWYHCAKMLRPGEMAYVELEEGGCGPLTANTEDEQDERTSSGPPSARRSSSQPTSPRIRLSESQDASLPPLSSSSQEATATTGDGDVRPPQRRSSSPHSLHLQSPKATAAVTTTKVATWLAAKDCLAKALEMHLQSTKWDELAALMSWDDTVTLRIPASAVTLSSRKEEVNSGNRNSLFSRTRLGSSMELTDDELVADGELNPSSPLSAGDLHVTLTCADVYAIALRDHWSNSLTWTNLAIVLPRGQYLEITGIDEDGEMVNARYTGSTVQRFGKLACCLQALRRDMTNASGLVATSRTILEQLRHAVEEGETFVEVEDNDFCSLGSSKVSSTTSFTPAPDPQLYDGSSSRSSPATGSGGMMTLTTEGKHRVTQVCSTFAHFLSIFHTTLSPDVAEDEFGDMRVKAVPRIQLDLDTLRRCAMICAFEALRHSPTNGDAWAVVAELLHGSPKEQWFVEGIVRSAVYQPQQETNLMAGSPLRMSVGDSDPRKAQSSTAAHHHHNSAGIRIWCHQLASESDTVLEGDPQTAAADPHHDAGRKGLATMMSSRAAPLPQLTTYNPPDASPPMLTTALSNPSGSSPSRTATTSRIPLKPITRLEALRMAATYCATEGPIFDLAMCLPPHEAAHSATYYSSAPVYHGQRPTQISHFANLTTTNNSPSSGNKEVKQYALTRRTVLRALFELHQQNEKQFPFRVPLMSFATTLDVPAAGLELSREFRIGNYAFPQSVDLVATSQHTLVAPPQRESPWTVLPDDVVEERFTTVFRDGSSDVKYACNVKLRCQWNAMEAATVGNLQLGRGAQGVVLRAMSRDEDTHILRPLACKVMLIVLPTPLPAGVGLMEALFRVSPDLQFLLSTRSLMEVKVPCRHATAVPLMVEETVKGSSDEANNSLRRHTSRWRDAEEQRQVEASWNHFVQQEKTVPQPRRADGVTPFPCQPYLVFVFMDRALCSLDARTAKSSLTYMPLSPSFLALIFGSPQQVMARWHSRCKTYRLVPHVPPSSSSPTPLRGGSKNIEDMGTVSITDQSPTTGGVVSLRDEQRHLLVPSPSPSTTTPQASKRTPARSPIGPAIVTYEKLLFYYQRHACAPLVTSPDRLLLGDEVRYYVRHLCDLLRRMHQNHLFHGDIKPQNVLLMPNGQIRLADFGFAGSSVKRCSEYVGYTLPDPWETYGTKEYDVWCLGQSMRVWLTYQYPTDNEGAESQYGAAESRMTTKATMAAAGAKDVLPADAMSRVIQDIVAKRKALLVERAKDHPALSALRTPSMTPNNISMAGERRSLVLGSELLTSSAPSPPPPSRGDQNNNTSRQTDAELLWKMDRGPEMEEFLRKCLCAGPQRASCDELLQTRFLKFD